MVAALFPDVVVNGETVPHTVVAAEAQNHTAPRGKPGIAWRKAANAVAMRTLLLQEARRRGLVSAPVAAGPGRRESEDEALIRQLLETAITVEPPTDAQIRAEWKRDPSRFRTPPLWEVSHILCACDPRNPADRQKAQTRARALAQRVQADPGCFAMLAARESDCSSRDCDGTLGQLGPGDTVPEFEAVLRGLAEGQVTDEPVLTRYGFHVIRLDAVAPGRPLPFEAVQGKIADAMEKAAWARKAQAFVGDLVAGADISGAELRPGGPRAAGP